MGGGVGESVGGRHEGSDPGNWGGTRAASCGLPCYTWLSPVGSWTARGGFVDDTVRQLKDDTPDYKLTRLYLRRLGSLRTQQECG